MHTIASLTGARPRIVGAALALLTLWMVACSSATASGVATATLATATTSLPDSPPDAANCPGTVSEQRDVQHPKLGVVRVFLVLRPAGDSPLTGCIAAVSNTGLVLTAIEIEVDSDKLHFAEPATDATGNTFILYNSGRYDGVLVLVPNDTGFEDIGATDTDARYQGGRFAFYYAALEGPGPDGRYRIRQSSANCTPSCAADTVSSQLLQWNGHEYEPS